MKYNDYPYQRIDIEAFRSNMDEWRKQFNETESVDVQSDIIQKVDEFEREYASYQAIASLNYNRNVNDAEAKAEKEYFDSIGPQASEISNAFNQDLVNSKFRSELEIKWGKQYFNQIELDLKTFDPSIMDMLLEETKLRNEYTQLIAGAQIEYNGETYNLAGLGPFHKDSERDIRKSSYEARLNWFQGNADAFDELYDKLVKLRHEIATTLGYDSFTELGYMRMGRSDYGPKEVANFRSQIVDYVVPLVKKLNKQRQEILGLDHLYFYDGINYKEGDPKPKGTPDDLVNKAVKMYDELSPETGEFFHKMVDKDLMDLVNRDGKMAGGFCTGFPKYGRPYIFSNFNGTDHDVTVLTHEAGHAFQSYESRKQPLVSYLWPTMEAAEIHSMSMEFITWPWMDLFFEEETDRFKYKHLAGALSFLPYGACVDHFQHWVYENPEATPQDRKDKWKELEAQYRPGQDYDGMPFPESGALWQQQLHIYQMPFYYIDYTLAQTCAFQFWMRFNKDDKNAWNDYLTLCQAGGSKPFSELVELAGLKSPFKSGTLKDVANEIFAWLENIDVKNL